MLQVFHVVVAYVAMGIHVCWKCIVPNVSSVSDACCKCFIRMLHMFHTYVASVSSFDVAYVSHICCKCDISMLHMFCNGYTRVFLVLQVFQLFWTHVASVLFRCCKSRSSVAHVMWNLSAAAACWTHMHALGCGGARAPGTGNSVGRRSRRGPHVGARRHGKRSGTGIGTLAMSERSGASLTIYSLDRWPRAAGHRGTNNMIHI
jgi:hypothetical protein